MYNPQTESWTQKVADLPEPLSSAKMELLDGLPTIVGGYNGETKIGWANIRHIFNIRIMNIFYLLFEYFML
jgi:hypothetical protein